METNKKVLAVLILDESGSMGAIKSRTISCVNEYLQSLEPQGKSCHMSLVTFNSYGIKAISDNIPIKDVPKLTEGNYIPNGNTPLLDAVGKTIKEIKEYQENSKDNPDILFIVMTDGEENNSREYSQRDLIDLISDREKAGWTFVYLGANQDSWCNASRMGYQSTNNVLDFVATPDGIQDAMSLTKFATANYFSERDNFYSSHKGRDLSALNYRSTSFYKTTNKKNRRAK